MGVEIMSAEGLKGNRIASGGAARSAFLVLCAWAPSLAEQTHAQSVEPWITRTSWSVQCETADTAFGPYKKGEIVVKGDGSDCRFDEAEAAAEAACRPFGVSGLIAPICHSSEPNPEWVEIREREIEAYQARQAEFWKAIALTPEAAERHREERQAREEAQARQREAERLARVDAGRRIFCGDGPSNHTPEAAAKVAGALAESDPRALLALGGDSRWRVRAAAGRNPRTPPSELLNLAEDCVEGVREAVGENPSTPFNVLVDLGLRTLDDPNRLREMEARRTSQGFQPFAPRRSLRPQQGSVHRFVEGAIGGLLGVFRGRAPEIPVNTYDLRAARWARELGEIDGSERPWTQARSGRPEARRDVARAKSTPPAVLDLLATDPDLEVRVSVAANPRTAPETLGRQVRDDHPEVRRVLARRPNTPAEVMELLARDYEYRVRQAVAGNHRTPPHVLVALSRDRVDMVVVEVAGNPSSPRDVIERLAKDQHHRVRVEARRPR